MTTSFDLHDTISVIIPGACAIALLGYFSCEDWEAFFNILKQLSSGVSLVLLLPSYVVGELIQSLGKMYVKRHLYVRPCKDPYYWIFNTRNPSDFLTLNDREKILDSLKGRFPWWKTEKIEWNEMLINACFYYIKLKVYAHDAYRTECVKMLTKLHFFASMMILCWLMPIAYLVMSLCSAFSCCGTHCLTRAVFFSSPCTQYSIGGFLMVSLLFGSCGAWWMHLTRDFNRIYNRCLYSSYLAILEKEKESTPNS